jgi:hypothetical protein
MTWLQLALWGLFGGFIVDGLEVWRMVRSNNSRWPAECLTVAFFVAEAIRLVASAGLAIAFGTTGQVSGPLGALAIGIAAPLIVEKLTAYLPAIGSNAGIDSSTGEHP